MAERIAANVAAHIAQAMDDGLISSCSTMALSLMRRRLRS
jgi:hypothetical protein